MDADKPIAPRGSWWSRQSFLRRILYCAVVAVIVLAIALGVGLGVGLNHGGGGGEESPEPSGTPPGSPTNPNGTFVVNSTWQIVLLDPLDISEDATSVTPDVAVFDIDMFTNNATVIGTLKRLGKQVICYFSAGSYEDFRSDADKFAKADLGKELDGWPGERWLNTSSSAVRAIMTERIQLAASKGCDALDPDNVDGFANDNGLNLTSDGAVDYIHFLSEEAAKVNLTIGLKNAADLVSRVLNYTSFAVNEQCVQFQECDHWSPYINAGKPVFHIEYPDGAPRISAAVQETKCTKTGDGEGSDGFSTVLKLMNLNGWVEYCNGATANTTMATS